MSCGCQSNPDTHTRAAMCCVCPDYAHEVGVCGLSQRPVAMHIRGQLPCHAGSHPNEAGVVVWCGVRWIGVPMPVRLWLWVVSPKHPKPSAFGGCGCILFLKRLFTIPRAGAHGSKSTTPAGVIIERGSL